MQPNHASMVMIPYLQQSASSGSLWHSPADTVDYCAPLVSPTVHGSHRS